MSENASQVVKRKSYDSFDLFKFLAAIVVIMAHTRIFGDSRYHWLHPWIRIAIPVFFMVSAFLFFSKFDKLPDEEKNGYLWKFVKRDLTLYLFWFIVFLPFTFVYRDYAHKGLRMVFGSIFLGSSFPASWYLMALAIGIVIVAKLNHGSVGRWLLPIVAFLMYLVCLGQFTWRPVADKLGLSGIYAIPDLRFANTFFVAPIWIWIGRIFVRYQEKLRAVSMKIVLLLFVLTTVLLWVEHNYLYTHGYFTMYNDVYLLCLLSGPMLFWVVMKLKIHLKNAKFMRCMSTLLYCIHATFIECLRIYVILPKFGEYEMPISILCFFVTLAFSFGLGWLILKGSEKIKILKYAY